MKSRQGRGVTRWPGSADWVGHAGVNACVNAGVTSSYRGRCPASSSRPENPAGGPSGPWTLVGPCGPGSVGASGLPSGSRSVCSRAWSRRSWRPPTREPLRNVPFVDPRSSRIHCWVASRWSRACRRESAESPPRRPAMLASRPSTSSSAGMGISAPCTRPESTSSASDGTWAPGSRSSVIEPRPSLLRARQPLCGCLAHAYTRRGRPTIVQLGGARATRSGPPGLLPQVSGRCDAVGSTRRDAAVSSVAAGVLRNRVTALSAVWRGCKGLPAVHGVRRHPYQVLGANSWRAVDVMMAGCVRPARDPVAASPRSSRAPRLASSDICLPPRPAASER